MLTQQLSDEATETLKGMVEFCIQRGYCMGMDEGIKVFADGSAEEVKHDFRKELELFCGMNEMDIQLQALALHLGIDVAKQSELDEIEVMDNNTGFHRFRHAKKVYVVATASHGLPTDITVNINGNVFAITNKYMVKITGLRTPAAVNEGWEDMVDQVYEYTGNAYYGFNVIMDDKEYRDLFHFTHVYINS